jgi:hypothetical protein
MANERIVKELTTRGGAHGISGGSIDNLDNYTDEVVNKCIEVVSRVLKDKPKLRNRVVNAIKNYFAG